MQKRKENRFTASWGGYIKLITKEEFENACVLVSNGVILIINRSPKVSSPISYTTMPRQSAEMHRQGMWRNGQEEGQEKARG